MTSRVFSKYFNGLIVLLLVLSVSLTSYTPALAQADSQFFPETGKTLSGKFLQHWRQNGGLAVFGFPITDAQNELNPEDNKTYLTQWFQRNRFELHPENAGTKFEVLLGLLGKQLRREALDVDPDFVRAPQINDPELEEEGELRYFPQTGHNVLFEFLNYWDNNGGLERFGFPISEAHEELDPETGRVFMMQWFERARLEFHPENEEPNEVLLGLLGNQIKAPKTKVDYLWKTGSGSGGFNSPAGVALDNQGNVYVVDNLNNRVQKFDNKGRLLAGWGKQGTGDGDFIDPNGITVDRAGNLYVVDRGNFRIQKFDGNGRFLAKWGQEGEEDGQFSAPVEVVTDSQGNIYVTDAANSVIQKFDSSGKFLAKISVPGQSADEGSQPFGLAIDGQGNFYLTDLSTSSVRKLDSSGKAIAKWGGQGTGDGQFEALAMLALDTQGNVYVADSVNGNIQKFDSSGKFLSKWGTPGSADGQMDGPFGVAVDNQGNVFVTDATSNRLIKFAQR